MKYLSENSFAAHLLAVAIKELFVGSLLLGGRVASDGFAYRFETRQEVGTHFLPLIEEKMRSLAKETAFQFLEMVPSNAAAFLAAKGEKRLAERALLSHEILLPIVAADRYVDINMGISKKAVSAVFSLFSLEADKGTVVIEGVARSDIAELKVFTKLWKKRPRVLQSLEEGGFALCQGESSFLLERGQEALFAFCKEIKELRKPLSCALPGKLGVAIPKGMYSWTDQMGDVAALSFSDIDFELARFSERAKQETLPLVIRVQRGKVVKEIGREEICGIKKDFTSFSIYGVDPFAKEWQIAKLEKGREGMYISSLAVKPIDFIVAKKISFDLMS